MIPALAIVGAITLAALAVGICASSEEVGIFAARLFLPGLLAETVLSVLYLAGVGS